MNKVSVWEIIDNYSRTPLEIYVGTYDDAWDYVKSEWGVGYSVNAFDDEDYESTDMKIVRG